MPKKMNRLGALAPAIRGFFSPTEEPNGHAELPAKKQDELPRS